MNRFLLILAAVFSFITGTQGAESTSPTPSASQRWNILFITIDDLGNVLGRTRPAGLETPHLDRLAKRSVFFERAYCQIPLCNPSRASFLTGQYPDALGVYDLSAHFRDRHPAIKTIPQQFRERGWESGRVGKIFHYDVPAQIGSNGLDDAASWDVVINPRGRDVIDEPHIINPTPSRPISAALSWLAAKGSDAEQTDGLIASEAIRLLGLFGERPFFLGVGFFRPHTPYVAPESYFSVEDAAALQLPRFKPAEWDTIPPAAIPHNVPAPNYGLSETNLKHALHAYRACVRFVDAQVGRILDAVDRLHLTESTIIILLSDHGYHLGEHGLWQKRTLYDPSSRVPLLISVPGSAGVGQTCPRVVQLIDIFPTLLELTNQNFDGSLPGKSLVPLLSDPQKDWPHPAFTQILRPGQDSAIMGRAVTMEDYRYIEWNEGTQGRQLFNLQLDPEELNDMSGQDEYAPVMKTLRDTFGESVRGTPPQTPYQKRRL
ncbi:sulfatase [Planctomicrobium sp. SH664]|uniref:sulfatase n=1 Tax=Planctomicrobium sp. SH664 TaxID=3448125 RepID=UPI003F5B82BE